jgi:hypothetical protein
MFTGYLPAWAGTARYGLCRIGEINGAYVGSFAAPAAASKEQIAFFADIERYKIPLIRKLPAVRKGRWAAGKPGNKIFGNIHLEIK